MGINIEKNVLRAMIAEILLEDKELLKNVLHTVFKENPNLLAELTGASTHVDEPSTEYKKTEKEKQNSDSEGISDEELNFWVDKHFEEYDEVFKALA